MLYACGDIYTFLNKSRIINHVRRVKTMKMASASRNTTICCRPVLCILIVLYAKKKCIHPRFLYACGDNLTFFNKLRIIKHVRRVKTIKMASASRNTTICCRPALCILIVLYAKKKCINPRFLYACGDIFTFLNKSRIIKHVRRVKTMKMASESRNATICCRPPLCILIVLYAKTNLQKS